MGKPGSGKSTLLRYAFDNVRVASDVTGSAIVLQFFFHGRGVELQKTPLGLFRSLLHQLLSQNPNALLDVIATFQGYCNTFGKPGEKWQWRLHELQRHFQSSLAKVLESRSVWLFVDALDESGKANAVQLVKDLKELVQKLQPTRFQFRICFACRHFPILEQNCKFEICLEHENGEVISTYVQAQVSTSDVLLASRIPALVTERATGIFMWARLAVDQALDLDGEGVRVKEIENRISSIPPELDELYLGLVRSMDKTPASLKLIQWICFATRPLSLDELRWAMIADVDCGHKSLQQCEDANDYACDSNAMEKRLKTLSRGIAEAVPSSGTTRVVQFIHQSVRDFFVEKGLSVLYSSLKAAEADVIIGRAQYRLSRTCLHYLAMEEIRQSASHKHSDYPLLRYATTSWVVHTKQSDARSVPQEDLLELFSWPSNALVELWVRMYERIERNSNDCPPRGTSLIHVMARYAVLGPLTAILQRADQTTEIDAKDDYGRTPLSWAAENGHETVIKLLLATGEVDVDSKDTEYGRTPLSWAASNGHEAVVKLLLETGKVDVDSKDTEYGRTPLWWAARNGHEAVVKLLQSLTIAL
jgi:hypothetical protein